MVSVKLLWPDYTHMWDVILAWKKGNGRLPKYIEIYGYKFMIGACQDAAKNVVQFRKDITKKEGKERNPNYVIVEGALIAVNTIKPTKNKGKWTLYFEQKMNVNLTCGDDAYNHLKDKKGGYGFYYEDIKSNTTIINNLANPNDNGEDSNCTDITQVLKKIYDEFNEKVEFIRAEVKCSNGVWYGHVFLRKVSNKKYVDGAGKLAHNYPIGKLICGTGTLNKDLRNISVNPAWLVNAADNK